MILPYTHEAYQLLHRGTQAFAEIEANGMRVDVSYLERTIRRTLHRIEHKQKELMRTEVGQTWQKHFLNRTNLNSTTQLGTVLFDILRYPTPIETTTGRYSTDEKALATLDIPFVVDFLKVKKYKKAVGTFLKGIQREVIDGLVHPFFNLNTVSTYRSSSEAFNFTNIPVRDPEIADLIRTAFIPRPGWCITEVDYSGIEVRVAACYHKDPSMIEYIKDPTKDMHRDMAMECYILTAKELGDTKTRPGKDTRYCGKNMFVFPQFYGDWYIDCARSLWDAIGKMKLVTSTGLSLREHLVAKGIHELGDLNPKENPRSGTFEAHIKQVERRFWENRFPVYNQWKKDWYEAYIKQGWFKTLTGFICQGYMKRNEVINYPVQGSAFHCLLWSLIRLIRHELKRRKMQTLIVGQIHDSIVADGPPNEVDEFLVLCRAVMVTQLMRMWDWICVPLDIEAEVTPVDGAWALKKARTIPVVGDSRLGGIYGTV